jgi:hypothetical protein
MSRLGISLRLETGSRRLVAIATLSIYGACLALLPQASRIWQRAGAFDWAESWRLLSRIEFTRRRALSPVGNGNGHESLHLLLQFWAVPGSSDLGASGGLEHLPRDLRDRRGDTGVGDLGFPHGERRP